MSSTFTSLNIDAPTNSADEATGINLATGKTVIVGTGSNAIAGTRTIAAGGSGVISTTKVTANSIIMLTSSVNTGVRAFTYEKRSVRSAGTSFKVLLVTGNGTAATGKVMWWIIN